MHKGVQLIQIGRRERRDIDPVDHARKLVGTEMSAARQAEIHIMHERGSSNGTGKGRLQLSPLIRVRGSHHLPFLTLKTRHASSRIIKKVDTRQDVSSILNVKGLVLCITYHYVIKLTFSALPNGSPPSEETSGNTESRGRFRQKLNPSLLGEYLSRSARVGYGYDNPVERKGNGRKGDGLEV